MPPYDPKANRPTVVPAPDATEAIDALIAPAAAPAAAPTPTPTPAAASIPAAAPQTAQGAVSGRSRAFTVAGIAVALGAVALVVVGAVRRRA